jgi:hypothetical protein
MRFEAADEPDAGGTAKCESESGQIAQRVARCHPGAEVQQPLATVVIGGLFNSTLLTLVSS